MGFLLGALGKQFAKKNVRHIQARLLSVQRRAQRMTRQIEQVTKSLESQKKAALSALSSQSVFTKMMSQTVMQSGMQKYQAALDAITNKDGYKNENGVFDFSKLTEADKEAYKLAQTEYTQAATQMQSSNSMMMQMMEQSMSMQKSQIEEYFAMMEEMQLQPLKDEEDALETEKASLESQLQLAQEDAKACEEMEKAGVKDIVPKYTSSGS